MSSETRFDPGRQTPPADRHASGPLGPGAGEAAPSTAASSAQAGIWQDAHRDKVVRIGIVGANFGSTFQWHLHPNCKVTAVCSRRDAGLNRMLQVYGPAAQYKSFREFLKHPELDAVAVFSPVPAHAEMSTEAMKAGKHVICAVPAGVSVEELELLLETVKTTGMKYMMAETSYYRREVITCREWARQGKFGTIFYTESEYHHSGALPLWFDERGLPTWRHGFPPMHYPTHCTSIVISIMGERLVEVQALGWGDGDAALTANQYQNPFWNTTGFFKTSGGHCSRIAIYLKVASGQTERGSIYGSEMTYIMERPEGLPNTVTTSSEEGETVIDANGYPEAKLTIEKYEEPNHWELLPPSLRVGTHHAGSHAFLTHDFIDSIVADRWPEVNVYEAIAYTLPGIVAHQSALCGGESMKIRDYGRAPA